MSGELAIIQSDLATLIDRCQTILSRGYGLGRPEQEALVLALQGILRRLECLHAASDTG